MPFDEVNSTTFKKVVEENREVIIGDSKSQVFLPTVEIKPWQDKDSDCLKVWKDVGASLSVSSDLSDKSRLKWGDSKEAWTISKVGVDTPVQFGTINSGIQMAFELSAKPKIDEDKLARFVFRMSGHQNLEFYIQTLENMLPGSERPDNVINSFAVYHDSKKDNQYKTGKFCHIYRPWCLDNLGNFTWGMWELDKVAGTLTKCIPEKAFNHVGATSWIVDAVFGDSSTGDSWWSNVNESSYAHGTATLTGDTSQLHCYCKDAGTARGLKATMYGDAGGPGQPSGNQLTSFSTTTSAGDSGVNTQINVNYVATLTDTVKYWVGWVTDTGDCDWNYDSGGGADTYAWFWDDNSGYTFSDPWGGDTGDHAQHRFCHWATYAAAAGDLSIDVADTIAIGESLSDKLPLGDISEADTISVGELATMLLGIDISEADTITFAEVVSASLGINVNETDTIGITEVMTILKDILPSLADTFGIAEDLTMSKDMGLDLADTFGITESLTASMVTGLFKSLADTFGLTEALVILKDIMPSLADTFGINEALTMLKDIGMSLADTIGFSEALTISGLEAVWTNIILEGVNTIDGNFYQIVGRYKER